MFNKKLSVLLIALLVLVSTTMLAACNTTPEPEPGPGPAPIVTPEPEEEDKAIYFEAEDAELYNCSVRETVSGRNGGIVQTFRDSKASAVTFYVESDKAESAVDMRIRVASAITDVGETDHDMAYYDMLTVNNESVALDGVVEARICASYEWCDITAKVDLIEGTNIVIFHYDLSPAAAAADDEGEDAYVKDGLDLRLNFDYVAFEPKQAALSVGENPQDDDFVYGITVGGASVKSVKDKNAKTLTVPETVETAFGSMPLTNLLEGALSGCGKLEKLTLPFVGTNSGDVKNETGDLCYIFGREEFEGAIAVEQNNGVTAGDHNWYVPESLTEVVVSGACNVNAGAFAALTTVKKIVFLNDDVTFELRAFWNCSGMEEVVLPNSDEIKYAYMFNGCSSLKNIIIPDAVTTLGGNGMFKECTSLEWVVIGVNVTEVVKNTFYQIADNLKTVYYKGTAAQWNTLKASIAAGNVIKTGCTVYYYSETESAGSWHYVEGVPTLWA